ncbi:MAG TPA: hypothetical protein VMS56_02890 [Thermoanaerobaculia bacterium]|nr:hypothetical protein [Thermoanaerobaculia bacterium]
MHRIIRAEPGPLVPPLSVAIRRSSSPLARKGFEMLPWLIAGLVVVSLLALKVLRDAMIDDKSRRRVPSRRF